MTKAIFIHITHRLHTSAQQRITTSKLSAVLVQSDVQSKILLCRVHRFDIGGSRSQDQWSLILWVLTAAGCTPGYWRVHISAIKCPRVQYTARWFSDIYISNDNVLNILCDLQRLHYCNLHVERVSVEISQKQLTFGKYENMDSRCFWMFLMS